MSQAGRDERPVAGHGDVDQRFAGAADGAGLGRPAADLPLYLTAPPLSEIRFPFSGRADRHVGRARAFDGVAYRWSFTAPAGEWVVLEAPYREFVPTFRGRILRDVPPIDPEKIRQLGLMIADKKEGPFRLEVDWIRAVE